MGAAAGCSSILCAGHVHRAQCPRLVATVTLNPPDKLNALSAAVTDIVAKGPENVFVSTTRGVLALDPSRLFE
jgi:hypothetical protein